MAGGAGTGLIHCGFSGLAAKDVVVAVGSNFTTLDPYDANDTLAGGGEVIYQGLFGTDKDMKVKTSRRKAIPFLMTV